MKNRVLCSLFFCAAMTAQVQANDNDCSPWNAPGAGNPFIPGYFADPTIRKFGDTYYLYATTDGTGNGYGPAQVWVSKDFTNWQNIVMNWPTTEVVWAPDVVEDTAADGKKSYRYFYCTPCNVYMGQSDSPVGPWKNVLGADDAVLVPDRFVHNAITLDPQLFRDDDGQEYLYFCTWAIYKDFGCGVAKLSDKGKVNGKVSAEQFFADKKLIPNTQLKDIFEAPYVFKRNGIYYFTYSSGSCHDDTYRVQYATSTVGPMGPFEYKGCILKTNADQTVHGPGHHSILVDDGRYYIVYHRHNLPRSIHGFNRQICIDEMKFDAEGNILPIVPTHDAEGTPASLPQTTKRPTPQTTNNLAFGAKVTASSYYDEWFLPKYAVDDNNATLWKAAGTNWGQGGKSGKAEWLMIDLGKTKRFSEVWTQFEYPTFFYQYLIETSTDGTHWTLFADRTTNLMQGSPMIDRAAQSSADKRATVKARYVRITITDTQKNGHMPAIWNVKIWQTPPVLPYPDVLQVATSSQPSKTYPGMHRKDVSIEERQAAHLASVIMDVKDVARASKAPFDVTTVTTPTGMTFTANKPVRARVKDGRWALFFNGSQALTSDKPLSRLYTYNAPFTISTWALQTESGSVSTVVSLSSSRADLATTELRLGTNPATGIVNHNGSFESSGSPQAVSNAVGSWHHWVLTFDGWMERIYLDGELLQEKNNFLMVRPQGHIVIGADAAATNNFKGYISELRIMPYGITAAEVKNIYSHSCEATLPSLGDEPFDESDPDSRFTLPTDMKPIYQQQHARLSATTADFNTDPTKNGATMLQDVKGDFVLMATLSDMEGLSSHSVTAYNEAGIIIKTTNPLNDQTTNHANDQYIHLGVFPLYNCGNMLTMLSQQGRPQFPNSKGYDFDPILQFERRGDLLYARTSRDGKKWTNMPGSPVSLSSLLSSPSSLLSLGIYQTTYTPNTSWAELKDIVIYGKK